MTGRAIKNKSIAFVSNNAWSVYNFRMDVIRHLLTQGYRILVIAPEDGFSPKLVEVGCRFISINFDNKSTSPLHDLLLYKRLRKIYRRNRPAFIFHYVAKPNIYGSMAAFAEGIPSVAVITGLGYAFAKNNWLHLLVAFLYK